MEIKTLTDIYAVTCELERPAAMKFKKGDRWQDVTVPELRDTVRWFSTGLRTLLRLERASREGSLRWELIPGPPAVRRIFELTGTPSRLPFRAAPAASAPR